MCRQGVMQYKMVNTRGQSSPRFPAGCRLELNPKPLYQRLPARRDTLPATGNQSPLGHSPQVKVAANGAAPCLPWQQSANSVRLPRNPDRHSYPRAAISGTMLPRVNPSTVEPSNLLQESINARQARP